MLARKSKQTTKETFKLFNVILLNYYNNVSRNVYNNKILKPHTKTKQQISTRNTRICEYRGEYIKSGEYHFCCNFPEKEL